MEDDTATGVEEVELHTFPDFFAVLVILFVWSIKRSKLVVLLVAALKIP